ncbi:MAG: dynamin family protein, partial [Pseudomonadota bacterium]
MEEFAEKIRGLYTETLDPLAEQFIFQRPPTVGEIKRPPIVVILGNHSSGKSTFINYLLGADVQKTGVAPTDDDFTLITYGDHESDRDGPAVVSNPDLPYEGLRHFGDQLVTHVRLKRRPVELLRNVTLIDTPGMIDEAKAESGRGYDFPGVVRWFAERADVVLVFFDPDKPGTTGETLQVFNKSLSGIDHKLQIVMNKMDQFRSMHDFARACGALCWNLGKVIPRKDLPLIYNTFVPLPGQPRSGLPMDDFEKAREDLVSELRRAPARRLDNMVTQVQTFAERLRLHAFVIDEAARELRVYRRTLWISLMLLFAGLSAAAVVTGLILALPLMIGVFLLVGVVFELFVLPRARKSKVA